MQINHVEGKKGAFFIEQAGERVAELQYFHPGGDKINIYHTEVDESLKGQGVGKQLVEAAAAYAREKGLKVEATCPYAAKVLAGGEYKDIFQP